jgi:hypothetical protein
MANIDISKFLGKPQEYTIMGEKVLIEPLKGEDINLFLGMKEGEEVEGVKKLIQKTFDMSDEEFAQLSIKFINEVSKAIMDANGLN